MKTRILTAAILVPLLLIIVLALPKIYTAIALGLMCAIAAYELLVGTGYIKHIRLVIYCMITAFLMGLWCYFGCPYVWGLLGIMLFCVALFSEMLLSHIKLRFEKLAMCFVAGVLVPYLLTSLGRIHILAGYGRYYIMLPLIMAFMADTGAYFAGKYLGKHKLAPVISPNKTVEGAVGGVACSCVSMLIYSFLLDVAFGFEVNYFYGFLYGLLGALASIFGDLTFSVIKRQTGIKDYGNLIPGHGGILDRFDSMLMVGPLAELLIILLPLGVK